MAEPKLRFLHYNDSLKIVFLHDIFKKITRKNKGNLVTNVITNSAKEGLLPQREYFDKDVANKDNTEGYYIIEEGDFVYNPRKSAEAPYGPFGRYNFSGEGIVSPLYTCLKIIDKNEINSDFLLYYFKSPAWYRYVYSNGDTGVRHDRVSIKDDTLLDMPIHIPNKDEQIKVVQLFKSIDDVIDIIKSDVSLWEEKKKGVIQKIFSQEVRFKKEDGSDYPEWEELLFMDIATLSKDKYNPNSNEQYKCIELDNIEQGTGQIKGYVISSEQNSIKNVFHIGDILFGKLRPYLRKYAKPNFDGVCSSEIWVLHPNKDVVCTEFLYYLVASDSFITAANVSFGTKMPRADWKLVSNMYFGIPAFEEQQKIADCLSFIDKAVEIKKQKLETWKNIKRGLLQQMFV